VPTPGNLHKSNGC